MTTRTLEARASSGPPVAALEIRASSPGGALVKDIGQAAGSEGRTTVVLVPPSGLTLMPAMAVTNVTLFGAPMFAFLQQVFLLEIHRVADGNHRVAGRVQKRNRQQLAGADQLRSYAR